MTDGRVKTRVAQSKVHPRTAFLLFAAAVFLLASIDEFAVRWTGSVAPRWIGALGLALAILGVWFGRRISWRLAAGALIAAMGILAYATLWPSAL